MPTYEYACKTCGNRFEAWQRITDDPLTECPKCHGEVRRVLFPAGIVFKGSGFYSTESRNSSSAASVPESKSEGTSASKPEPKAESKSDTSSSSGGETAKAS